MRKTDNLAPVLFQGLLAAVAVLAAGGGAILWWQRRFQPSSPTIYAVWTAFIWSYVNFFRLAFIPENMIASTSLAAVLRGMVLVAVTWTVVRVVQRRKQG